MQNNTTCNLNDLNGDSLAMQRSPSKTDVPGITLHVQYDSIVLVGMAIHILAAEHNNELHFYSY